jgi:5'-nucleotidase / UDP-sugar diphosphatase
MTLARNPLPACSSRTWSLKVAACLALITTSLPAQELDKSTNLVLMHFNDFHGQVQPLEEGLGGFAVLASCVEEQRRLAREQGAALLLLDAGDWFQGTPEGNESRGSLVVRLMNRLRVDAAVLGNHEFDFGHLQTRRLAAQASYPVLGANIHAGTRHEGLRWLSPYVVRVVAGMRIGIFGLITQRTRLVSTGPFGNLRYADEIETLERWMPRLRADCDAIVLLTHCGLAKDKQLAERFPEVQLILGGHSHTSLKQPVRVGSTWIAQTGARSKEIDRVQLRVDPLSRRIRLILGENLPLRAANYAPDPLELDWLAQETSDIRSVWDRPIGRLEGDFGKLRTYGSTAAGNLVADLIRDAGKARIGLQNKGGLRTRLRTGPLTLRLTYQLLPFQNHVVSMDLTGTELRAVLLEGILEAGRPFEVSGMRYEILRGEEGPLLGRAWLGPGDEIVADKVYRVATNSFMAGGGDGAQSFKNGRKLFHHRILLRELLVAAAKKRKVIQASGEKRIVLVQGQ